MLKLEDIGFLEIIEERAKGIGGGKISYCEWIITSNCNFGCPYCNRLENKDLGIEKIGKIIETLRDNGCKYIHLTGGEPTTRGDLLEIIGKIREAGIRVGISTNGSKDLEYYKDLVDRGVELFSISLDVHRGDMNKKFTMVGNIFDVVVGNIRELSKLVYVNVGIVFNDNNIGEYREIIKYISDLGVGDIRIMTATQYNKVGRYEIGEDILGKHPILRYRVENFNNGRNMRGSGLAKTGKCHLVRDDITIYGEEYYSCAVYVREGGRAIGNIFEGIDREGWFRGHDSHGDEICREYCMDFKCRFNDRVEELVG
jgi:MoaA/NifB/PqqE/SkfB family radical SAM enzyme